MNITLALTCVLVAAATLARAAVPFIGAVPDQVIAQNTCTDRRSKFTPTRATPAWRSGWRSWRWNGK